VNIGALSVTAHLTLAGRMGRALRMDITRANWVGCYSQSS